MNLRPRNSSEIAFDRARSSVISAFMSRVYGWMMLGIMLTGLVSYGVGTSPDLVNQVFTNKPFFWGIIIVQFGAVIFLSAMITRISAAAAAITFLMYSALTGLTLSMIFQMYTDQSIAAAFVTTAAGFGGLSFYGFTTKRDLGPVGSFCMMALFGLIAVMLLSFFIPSLSGNGMQIGISIAGLLIFAGLTAYDTQRIKSFANSPEGALGQMAVFGALMLYLDFINLFINLLRLMGDRR
jgi:FtsH-binding integral membrane protein